LRYWLKRDHRNCDDKGEQLVIYMNGKRNKRRRTEFGYLWVNPKDWLGILV
jgi:hypothetical protein